MKRNLLLAAVLCCLCLPAIVSAQNTFAPVGAQWWYGGSLFDYSFWDDYSIKWVDHMESVKDTVVAGKSCRLLAAVRYTKTNLSVNSANTAQVRYRDTFYVYNNDDTVFVYDKVIAAYTPLYIFNVAVGDTVCLRKPNYNSAGAEFCIIIDSIKLEMYDTVPLKSYYNHTIVGAGVRCFGWGGPKYIPESGIYSNMGKYTERIGGNWPKLGSFFPCSIIYNPDYYKESEEIPTGSFRCYSDPVTAIKMETIACDSVIKPWVSIAEVTKSDYGLSVYPNPTKGAFHITAQKPLPETLTIQLTDLAGRVLKTISFLKGQRSIALDAGQVPDGIYFLKFQATHKAFYQKVIIQH